MIQVTEILMEKGFCTFGDPLTNSEAFRLFKWIVASQLSWSHLLVSWCCASKNAV